MTRQQYKIKAIRYSTSHKTFIQAILQYTTDYSNLAEYRAQFKRTLPPYSTKIAHIPCTYTMPKDPASYKPIRDNRTTA